MRVPCSYARRYFVKQTSGDKPIFRICVNIFSIFRIDGSTKTTVFKSSDRQFPLVFRPMHRLPLQGAFFQAASPQQPAAPAAHGQPAFYTQTSMFYGFPPPSHQPCNLASKTAPASPHSPWLKARLPPTPQPPASGWPRRDA